MVKPRAVNPPIRVQFSMVTPKYFTDFRSVAQSVEQWNHNPPVVGSIPATSTKFNELRPSLVNYGKQGVSAACDAYGEERP